MLAREQADDDVDTHQRFVGDARIDHRDLAVPGLGQDVGGANSRIDRKRSKASFHKIGRAHV